MKQYAHLLRTYVEMRQGLVDLLRTLDEEEIDRGTGSRRTAADLLDMAFEYIDEARERLEPVDKLMMSVQPLFFGYSLLIGTPDDEQRTLDNLRDLLDDLNLDIE
ncbi:MAG: hypothetical protein R2856_10405 [Caldilineaceae bacterium]